MFEKDNILKKKEMETEELSNANKKLKEQLDIEKDKSEKVVSESKLLSESLKEVTDQNNKFIKENKELI